MSKSAIRNWEGMGSAFWETRRLASAFMFKHGWYGVFLIAAGLIIFLTLAWVRQQDAQQLTVPVLITDQRGGRTSPAIADERTALSEFESFLLPYDQIPEVIQSLFKLAEEERLVLTRGEYKPQPISEGGFMRYGMSFPVKGETQAVGRFMFAALRTHRALALQTVQFKRENVSSNEVEARIQWVLFTRLPDAKDARSVALIKPLDAKAAP